MTLVACTITLAPLKVSTPYFPSGNRRVQYVLFDCWTRYPAPTTGPSQDHFPITVQELKAFAGPADVTDKVSVTSDGRVTTFRMEDHDRAHRDSPLRIEFTTPNVFYSLPGTHPFRHWLLSFNLNLLPSATSLEQSQIPTDAPGRQVLTEASLEFPTSLALRMRVDNSEYHDYAIGLPDDHGSSYHRKVSFFEKPETRMQYRFGINDPIELRSPGFVLLQTGLGILSAGVALHMIGGQPSYPNIAAVLLGVALLVPFLETFRRARLFFPSSAVPNRSAERQAVKSSVLAYIVTVPPAITTVMWFRKTGVPILAPQPLWGCVLSVWKALQHRIGANVPSAIRLQCSPLSPGQWSRVAEHWKWSTTSLMPVVGWWTMIVGIFLVSCAIFYFLKLEDGTLQRYACDGCGHAIRPNVELDASGRKLCIRCSDEAKAGQPMPRPEGEQRVLAPRITRRGTRMTASGLKHQDRLATPHVVVKPGRKKDAR